LKFADDDSNQPKDQNGVYFNPTIQFRNARLSADGTVYILKASAPAKIQQIDQEGNILKTLELASPAPGAHPYEFFIKGNSLAVSYLPTQEGGTLNQGDVMLYDAKTGSLKGRYQTPGGGIFACGQNNTLTYLGPTPDHKLYHVGVMKLATN
jgi:hypothetical protein